MRKPQKYDNEIRSQFRKFIYKLATKLVDIVENEFHEYNSSPEINKIVQAVFTLMFIFRVRYRNVYHSVHGSIIHRKKFLEFCRKFYEQEKLPYFFTFLLNLSMKFEMFLYLRDEGHNYFGAFAFMVGEDTNYFYFEAKGGVQRLAETADYFLQRVKDLQVLVKLEDPLSDELLSLDDQLDYVNVDDIDASDYDSLVILQDIDRSLYSGLHKYVDKKVLPYIILRFILHGRVPDLPASKEKKKIPIDKYFNRCLVPEIVNGEAFKKANRAEALINDNMDENFRNEANVNNVSKKGRKRNRKKKSKQLKSQNVSEETGCSSDEKNYGNGLEWLRGFDAKTSSLLNTDNPKDFEDILHSVEDSSSRKDFNPLSETATGTVPSVKYNLGVRQKEENNLHVKSSFSKTKSHKGPKENIKDESDFEFNDESDDGDFFSTFDEADDLVKLKDTLMSVINQAEALHSWEKKIIICLIKEASVFTEQEIIVFSEKIRSIPDKDYINPGEQRDLKQFFEVIKMEDKCESLYSENGDEKDLRLGKLPCPEDKEIITEKFTEIMVCVLALSCENLIQVDVIGNWIPILQEILLKKRQLTRLFIRYGPNSLLPFLSSYAEMLLE